MQQLLRRTIQLSVLALLFAIPYLNLYGALRKQGVARDPGNPLPLRTLHATVGRLDESEHVTSFLNGSLWTMTLGGLRLSDPLAVIESIASAKTIHWGFLLSALIPVLLTVVLGRVFCGWLCPMHLVFEMATRLRRRVGGWLGWQPHDVAFDRRNAFRVLFGGLLAALVFSVPVFPLFYPPAVFGREVFYAVFYGQVGFGTALLVLLVLFETALSERSWCRYFCPGGAVYSFLGRKRLLRVRRDDTLCTSCGECDHACPFALSPMTADELSGECDNCGLCVASCESKALRQVSAWTKLPDRDSHPESVEAEASA